MKTETADECFGGPGHAHTAGSATGGDLGPATLGQIEGELTTGICTFNGQLRMVTASHDPLQDYLDRVRDVIDAAC
jgi:hypothetical protein